MWKMSKTHFQRKRNLNIHHIVQLSLKHLIAQKQGQQTSMQKIDLLNKIKSGIKIRAKFSSIYEISNKIKDEIKIRTKILYHIQDVQSTFQKPKEPKHTPYDTYFIKHLTTKKHDNTTSMQRLTYSISIVTNFARSTKLPSLFKISRPKSKP